MVVLTKPDFRLLSSIIVIIWLVGVVNWLFDYQLNRFGILPRTPEGLTGILCSPFLHGNFLHLINNTIGFFIFGWLVSLNRNNRSQLLKLTFFVVLVGGTLTWMLARPSLHVGLSGVIFGYWSFVSINGLFERSLRSILISVIAIFFYSSMIFGVMPSASGVSFESHLFGAISGVMYSYFYRRKAK